MPRVRKSVSSRKRRKKIIKQAKGYFGARSRLYRTATEAVDRAMRYAYRDRKAKKRDFRKLWIIRINAAARMNNTSYSRLINGMNKTGVEINRKILADLAISDPIGFSEIVSIATGERAT